MVFGPVGSFAVVSALKNGFLYFSIKLHFSAGNALWAVLCGVSRAKLCSSTVPPPQCRFSVFFPAQCVGNKSAYFCAARLLRKGNPLHRPKTAATQTFGGFFGRLWVHPPVCRDLWFSQAAVRKCAFQWFHTGNKHIRYTRRPTVQFLVRTLLVTKVLIFAQKTLI